MCTRITVLIGSIIAASLSGVPTAVLAAADDDYTLKSAEITFETPDRGDNKDDDTAVSVEVVAIKGDDTTPIANKVDFAGKNDEFKNNSTRSFGLDVQNRIKKGDMNRLSTTITIKPNGNDRWIFNYTLKLTFEQGNDTKVVSQKVSGVILDQDYNTRTTETWIKSPDDRINWTLKNAKIVFTTPARGDNKDGDTSIDVDLTCHINERIKLRTASKSGFAGNNNEFKNGSTHEFDLDIGTRITLDQLSKSRLSITITPNGNDRWIFDYALVLTFEGQGQEYECVLSQRGIILDQDYRTLAVD